MTYRSPNRRRAGSPAGRSCSSDVVMMARPFVGDWFLRERSEPRLLEASPESVHTRWNLPQSALARKCRLTGCQAGLRHALGRAKRMQTAFGGRVGVVTIHATAPPPLRSGLGCLRRGAAAAPGPRPPPGSRILRENVSDLVREHFRSQLPGWKEDQTQLEAAVQFVVSALIGVITWWLDNDVPYSAEDIYLMFRRLTTQGVKRFLAA